MGVYYSTCSGVNFSPQVSNSLLKMPQAVFVITACKADIALPAIIQYCDVTSL